MKPSIAVVLLTIGLGFQPLIASPEIHGFVDGRYGLRTQSDPNADQETLAEIRLQLQSLYHHDLFTTALRTDLLFDSVAGNHDRLDLETGEGPIDLREAYVLFSPSLWMDVKAGRQILTWGTGDLLFVNDLFPKDWKSFFAGRDVDYLKAPSDALFLSFFPAIANIDVAYTPRFDADRHIDGERFSYWNGQRLSGDRLQTDPPERWFSDYEIAARAYRTLQRVEVAGYLYRGFWKTPQGFDPQTGHNTFPELSVYGASARGPLAGGIARIEAGYYDSREDRSGTDPFIRNSELRLLTGFEREIARDLTGAVQYYIEHMLHHDRYMAAYPGPPGTAAEETRHVLTLRLTRMLMNQNLMLSLFSYWSPSDQDGYLRPGATYKLSDSWRLEAAGGFWFGRRNHTFFGQFQDNNNLSVAARYSF